MTDANDNPFVSPGEASGAVNVSGSRGLQRVAFFLLLAPIPIGIGIRWWAFAYMPEWLVSPNAGPEKRLYLLGFLSIILGLASAVVLHFAAFVIFYQLKKYPYLTGALTILYGLLLLPALFVFWWLLISS